MSLGIKIFRLQTFWKAAAKGIQFFILILALFGTSERFGTTTVVARQTKVNKLCIRKTLKR